jgi:hypothetical protein
MTLITDRNIIELSPASIDRNASHKHVVISNPQLLHKKTRHVSVSPLSITRNTA